MNEKIDTNSESVPLEARLDHQSPLEEQAEIKEPPMEISAQEKKPWTRSKIMRYIVAPIFAVLMIIALLMAILNLTVLKPKKIVSAQTSTSTNYVVADSGVANVVSNEVSITATIKETAAEREKAVAGDKNAQKRTICVAVGSMTDVDAWMKSQAVAYTRLTGLQSWSNISTAAVAKSGTAVKDSVSVADSDLWQQSNCAERTATLRLTDVQSEQKVIIYSPSGVSAVRMNWTRKTIPNTSLPWFAWMVVFAVATVLALTWLAGTDPFGSERRKAKKEAERAAQANSEGVQGVDTPYVPYQKKSTSGITHRTRKNSIFKRSRPENSTATSDTVQEDSAASKNKPVIVDPSSVNMVASTGAGETESSWSPSLISTGSKSAMQDSETSTKSDSDSDTSSGLSGEELLEYFARLAIEDRTQSADSESTGTADTNSPETSANGETPAEEE